MYRVLETMNQVSNAQSCICKCRGGGARVGRIAILQQENSTRVKRGMWHVLISIHVAISIAFPPRGILCHPISMSPGR